MCLGDACVWWKQVVKGLKKQLDVKSAKDEKDTKVGKEIWLTVGEVDERAMTGRSQTSTISKVY